MGVPPWEFESPLRHHRAQRAATARTRPFLFGFGPATGHKTREKSPIPQNYREELGISFKVEYVIKYVAYLPNLKILCYNSKCNYVTIPNNIKYNIFNSIQ